MSLCTRQIQCKSNRHLCFTRANIIIIIIIIIVVVAIFIIIKFIIIIATIIIICFDKKKKLTQVSQSFLQNFQVHFYFSKDGGKAPIFYFFQTIFQLLNSQLTQFIHVKNQKPTWLT